MFHGGVVKENGEFENMTELVETFDGLPTFKDVVVQWSTMELECMS
jgi:hypothetical protein